VPRSRRTIAAGSKLVPIETDLDDQQRSECERDDTNSGQDVAEVAPVRRPEVQHSTGDKGKGHCVGAGHPLAVHNDLAIACSDESGRCTDHPGRSLHGGTEVPGRPCRPAASAMPVKDPTNTAAT
jgi:hypothetical protein